MTVFLTFATAIAAGFIIDRLAFHGELSAMVWDEIALVSALGKSTKARRLSRHGGKR